MTIPMSSRNTFATHPLTQTFVWDAWFHPQIVYFKIKHPSIINKIYFPVNNLNFTEGEGDGIQSRLSSTSTIFYFTLYPYQRP